MARKHFDPAMMPTDDELWKQRKTFSVSTFALGTCHMPSTIRKELQRRGWDFNRGDTHHQKIIQAPCAKCGIPFVVLDQKDRLCPPCTAAKVEIVEQWQVDLAWGKQRLAEREARRDNG